MKNYFIIVLLLFSSCSLIAQSYNRKIVIETALHNTNTKVRAVSSNESGAGYMLHSTTIQTVPKFSDPIPKYCLPKGSFVCRFEEYVQLHSPMKLNIGLAGQ